MLLFPIAKHYTCKLISKSGFKGKTTFPTQKTNNYKATPLIYQSPFYQKHFRLNEKLKSKRCTPFRKHSQHCYTTRKGMSPSANFWNRNSISRNTTHLKMEFVWIRFQGWRRVGRSVTWNRFPIFFYLRIDSLVVSFVETSYLSIDIWKFKSSQKKKAEPSLLIPLKLTANLELSMVVAVQVAFPRNLVTDG